MSQTNNPPSPFRAVKTAIGRVKELELVLGYVARDQPQCCALVGDTYLGKTFFLRSLLRTRLGQSTPANRNRREIVFVYFDAQEFALLPPGIDQNRSSLRFWTQLVSAVRTSLNVPRATPEVLVAPNSDPADMAYIKYLELDELLARSESVFVLLLDNFEGISRLPSFNSSWLYALAQRADRDLVYVAASRYEVSLNYAGDRQSELSELWKLFADNIIHVGLLSDAFRREFVSLYSRQTNNGVEWHGSTVDHILGLAGGHPTLLVTACASYESHMILHTADMSQPLPEEGHAVVKLAIARRCRHIFQHIWNSLCDPELEGEPGNGKPLPTPSRFQQAVESIAAGQQAEAGMTSLLEQRSLIEKSGDRYRVFCDLFREYLVVRQQGNTPIGSPTYSAQPASPSIGSRPDEAVALPATRLTYREGRAYNYLLTNSNKICDRQSLLAAIWDDEPPRHASALQKTMERVRRKIESEQDSAHELVAVRGKGFILRTSKRPVT